MKANNMKRVMCISSPRKEPHVLQVSPERHPVSLREMGIKLFEFDPSPGNERHHPYVSPESHLN